MAFTYSGNPASSARDEVRFLCSDTSSQPWSVADAEIDYALTLYSANPPVIGQNFRAAAECAANILGNLKGALADASVGDLHASYNNATLGFYEAAYCRLMQRANLQAVQPYVGGASYSDKQAVDSDSDRVPVAHRIDGMRNPNSDAPANDPWPI